MPDRRDYILHYTKYFNMEAPSSLVQAIIITLMGAVAGALSSAILIYSSSAPEAYTSVLLGACVGVIAMSVPAFLTVILIKTMNRRMLLKHALLSTIVILTFYAIVFIANAAIFALLKNAWLAYVLLLVSNAGIYGYWFIVGRIVIGEGKSVAITAAIQPVLNVLFYLPLSTYLLAVPEPLATTMVKLVGGMSIFLAASYAFFYVLDRPTKRLLDVSGVKILSSVLSYWLYNLTNDIKIIGDSMGRKRTVEIDVLALKGAKGVKAVFVNPDIHFGPLMNFGGSIAPKYIGDMIADRGSAPFVLHTAIGIEDNPISASQVYGLSKEIGKSIGSGLRFRPARGYVSLGRSGRCKAIAVRIGSASLVTLTKAPYVTEDMSRDVGLRLKKFAMGTAKNAEAIMIDAHNSRFESAPAAELAGIGANSKYIPYYESAIARAMRPRVQKSLRFGTAYKKLHQIVGAREDLGAGYTSVGVFEFGGERFCMVYFDANNMLPGFRDEIIAHIKEKFGIWAEIYTTDTHAINTVALDTGNVLGRHTKAGDLLPVVDLLVGSAIGNMELVSYAYSKIAVKDFKVWGYNADALIEKVSRDVRRTLLRIVPFLIAAAFVVAAWVISVI